MNVFRSSVYSMVLFAMAALLASCAYCGPGELAVKPDKLSSARAQIYERANVEFQKAEMYKPNDAWMDQLGVKLAPLLMQQVASSKQTSERFGLLTFREGKLSLEFNKPTLYFQIGKVHLKGAERDQAVFLWFNMEAGWLVPQGVRITLDSDGHPAVWEILDDASGIQQIFVSRSLETAAAAQNGAPFPNRRSALEHSVASAPMVTVSRVISDGPMAMGPAIYLNATNHNVETLMCRCMPPQVKEVVTTHNYEIADLGDPTTERLVKQALRASNVPAKHWLNEGAEEMEMRLRLPNKF